jgi:hypothetical protein
MSPAIVMAIGPIAPAPMPCTARKAMRAGMLHARPQRIEPTRNTAMPTRITGLRPTRSASFANSGVVTACVSR